MPSCWNSLNTFSTAGTSLNLSLKHQILVLQTDYVSSLFSWDPSWRLLVLQLHPYFSSVIEILPKLLSFSAHWEHSQNFCYESFISFFRFVHSPALSNFSYCQRSLTWNCWMSSLKTYLLTHLWHNFDWDLTGDFFLTSLGLSWSSVCFQSSGVC